MVDGELAAESAQGNPSRRTILVGTAWSVPVLAAAVAVPLAAATTPELTLVFLQPLGVIGACDTNTTGVLRVSGPGGAVDGALVTVTLPAGLAWADGTPSSTKVFTTDASGDVPLAGEIRGTGGPGIHSVIAATPGAAQAVGTLQTTVTKSAIWYSGNASTVSPADTAGVVVNPVALAVTAAYAYAQDAAGGWYAHSGAVDGDWRKIDVPPVDEIFAGEGGTGYGFALIGGEVYRAHPNGTATHLAGISGVTKFVQTGNRLFAVDGTGKVQRFWTSWTPVTISGTSNQLVDIVDLAGNEGGGYGWAISGTDIYYMLDNNLAYLSTTTAQKPVAPQQLAIGAGWAYALDADGSVWSHAGASAGNWFQLSGLPGPAISISENEGGNFIWALVDGRLYSSAGTAAFTLADSASTPLPGAIVDYAIGAGYAYAKLADGSFWSHAGAGAGAWTRMTGTPNDTVEFLTTNYGNYSWFIADNRQTC